MQTKDLYGNIIKGMDDYPSFSKSLSFLKMSIPSGISITNKHQLILDGHGSHVTLEAIERLRVRIGYDYSTFTYISCTSILGCGLVQTFEDCF
jgi:hypothetical protein